MSRTTMTIATLWGAQRYFPPVLCRHLATVSSRPIFAGPPAAPVPQVQHEHFENPTPHFDQHVLSALRNDTASLHSLIEQYTDRHGRVLDSVLPYESRPNGERKLSFGTEPQIVDDGVFIIAHALEHNGDHQVTICSGFALGAQKGSSTLEEKLVVTCAHTLEKIRHSPLASELLLARNESSRSGSFVISGASGTPNFHPVTSVASTLQLSGLMLLTTPSSSLRSLPISPYPAYPGATIRAHFVTAKKPDEDGWRPWVGGTWSKWVRGTILEYRDFAGKEAQPGTYDALSHMLFQPLPTPGSSGGPIVDEESGAVVGVMIGTRMDNPIVGVRGWGVPAEAIYEMFSLPGLSLKNGRSRDR